MTELDDVWADLLGDAAQKASASGRHQVAEYLKLKATNDAIRERGVAWLFETTIELAHSQSSNNAPIATERISPHNFKRGSSNMAGSRLVFRQGVRCLAIEAGWTRTPSDGIMACAALAFARFSHFGMPRNDSEIRLVHADELPHWIDSDDTIIGTSFIQRHFESFLA